MQGRGSKRTNAMRCRHVGIAGPFVSSSPMRMTEPETRE
jgi:hypothetical protein